jgi:DnaJ-class molecular chaperone
MNFKERKLIRIENYLKYDYKKKLKTCISCNGSGYYDNFINGHTPKCSSCNGTGKIKEFQN